jgi:hypothetical protein
MLQYFINLDYLQYVQGKPKSPENYLEAHKCSRNDRMKLYGPQPHVDSIKIMIPALEKREAFHSILADELTRQGLDFEFDYTEGITIGEKRERMYRRCTAPYCIQIDDDDWLSHDFGPRLREALRAFNGVDCIVYNELVFMNDDQPTFTMWGLEFDIGRTQEGFFVFSPGPKMCIKTEIAQQIPFQYVNKGEDMAFRESIKPLLKTQARLPGWHITYEYTSKGTSTNSQEERFK